MIVSRWMSFCERMFWVLLVKMGLLLMFFRIFSNTFVKIALIMRILCIFSSQNIPRKILKEKGPGLRSLYSTWSPKNEQNHYKLYIWRRERERERVGDWRVQKEMRRCKNIHYVVLNPNPFGSFLFFSAENFEFVVLVVLRGFWLEFFCHHHPLTIPILDTWFITLLCFVNRFKWT